MCMQYLVKNKGKKEKREKEEEEEKLVLNVYVDSLYNWGRLKCLRVTKLLSFYYRIFTFINSYL